jgi:periplasmic copper chaperone A
MRTMILLVAAGMGLAMGAVAHEGAAGPIALEHPWARPEPSDKGFAIVTMRNTGDAPDRLVSASVPREVAERAEPHTYAVDQRGVEVMRLVPAVELPGGANGPVGLAIKLVGLKGPLVEGKSFPLTLSFEKAGRVTVDVVVERTPSHGIAALWPGPAE